MPHNVYLISMIAIVNINRTLKMLYIHLCPQKYKTPNIIQKNTRKNVWQIILLFPFMV